MREPFPGNREGRPFGAFALVWALPEEQRREIAWIELGEDATLAARGRQWCGDEPSYELEYALETSPGYVTERLHVSVAGGPELTLERGRSPELEGALDCDLAASPLTNAMPVLRARLDGVTDAHTIEAAWVSVPDLTVHRDRQIYEPLDGDRVRFCSPDADFERVIQLTASGFVRDYPGIAQLLATIVRIPLDEIVDWDSFHAIVAAALELPPHGGRSVDAWIDCLTAAEREGGAGRYAVPGGTALTLQLDGLSAFAERCPAQYGALIGAVGEVNRRRSEAGEPARLSLSASR